MVDEQLPGSDASDRQSASGDPVVLSWLSTFGHFWWEFLIGDTPELFVGAVAVIGVVALVSLKPGLRTFAAFLAPVLVAGVLTASVYRAARKRPS
ncbi:MAG TPA: hypothetical protein VIH95_12130 [Acidimicrobiales bacterium]